MCLDEDGGAGDDDSVHPPNYPATLGLFLDLFP